ncbi:MAG TPA: toll/interleukin-1 receptor domain-containing protein [Burkholderiales bacterium]|nr:toll/interleukin-1 receptor domain-containing protein [Burkholderiales bacterium]
MPGIFISYRRSDGAGQAGRLYEQLIETFHDGAVFMDVETIEPGLDFVEAIQRTVASCNVLLAVIGKDWVNASDASGKRRLSDRRDFVRLEISAALERGMKIRVIPLLVGGATMPSAAELPGALKALARRQAYEVRDARFRPDVENLVRKLLPLMPKSTLWRSSKRLQKERNDQPTVVINFVIHVHIGDGSDDDGRG